MMNRTAGTAGIARLISYQRVAVPGNPATLVAGSSEKGALIVWNIIVTKPHSVLGYEEAQVAYLCVKRDGVWFYPLNAVINIVQQESDKVQVLKSWKEDRLRATKFIEHFVALPDETLNEAIFSGNMKTLIPVTEEDV